MHFVPHSVVGPHALIIGVLHCSCFEGEAVYAVATVLLVYVQFVFWSCLSLVTMFLMFIKEIMVGLFCLFSVSFFSSLRSVFALLLYTVAHRVLAC